MRVEYMTLDGRKERLLFLEEWWNSDKHDATFLQAGDCIYLMPYGHFSFSNLPGNKKNVRFAGTHRQHTYVKRDFEITDTIIGGGYLILNEDRKSCRHEQNSTDFGGVPEREAVVVAVTEALLR